MVKHKSERKEAWMRVFIFVITGCILYIWFYLNCVVAILNWICAIFSGKRSSVLANFAEYFNTEIYKFSSYISGVSNRRPFPFTDLERLTKFEKN
jgi:hypothetical protein